MDGKREERHKQMTLLAEEEKRLLRSKRKLWYSGRKATRVEMKKLMPGTKSIVSMPSAQRRFRSIMRMQCIRLKQLGIPSKKMIDTLNTTAKLS